MDIFFQIKSKTESLNNSILLFILSNSNYFNPNQEFE